VLVEQAAARGEVDAERVVLLRCHETVGWTTSRPSLSRSSVASWWASRSGWRSGAMIAAPMSRSVAVAEAMALIRTMESGHGVAGSWLPGAA
jgi:hypothetical protein